MKSWLSRLWSSESAFRAAVMALGLYLDAHPEILGAAAGNIFMVLSVLVSSGEKNPT